MSHRYLLAFMLMLLPLHAEFLEYEEFDELEEFELIDLPIQEDLVTVHPKEDELEAVLPEFVKEDMIAAQENREALLEFIHSFSEKEYQVLSTKEGYFFAKPGQSLAEIPEIDIHIECNDKKEVTVVDYGAGNGMWSVALSHLTGRGGKIIAFESHPKLFREMFWNLVLNHVQNVELYCAALGEKEKTLDSLELENVALIRINAGGREDLFLKGARKTIEKQHPILIINMSGGIPAEWGDRYVYEELQKRIEHVSNMGYTTKQLGPSEVLAVPKAL